jgi:isocitrate dehydrogenase
MSTKTPITVAKGDGIGPEIMDATLRIMEAAGAQLEIEEIQIGEQVYLSGNAAGIAPEAWDSLRRTKVFLKAPITTPQGGGYKSLNVTTRKMLSLYANIRPCIAYAPYVDTKYPNMDLVIIRENEEDTYAGIEHQQTDEVVQCLKLISRPGCEKIVRYAFEYAKQFGRKKVTCFSKDNIMKMTDGLFHKVFDEIGAEYPEIEQEHWIIDIGSAKMSDTPEAFDVIVTLNLYGDIISDIAAQIAGSVGLAGSANIGPNCAMFEAIHGSAPRRAGQNMANPSGLLLGAVQMLVHIGQTDAAENVHNAWLKTLEDGVHTYDIYKEGLSTEKVGTKEFADAVIARVGQKPSKFKAVSYATAKEPMNLKPVTRKSAGKKETVGVDVFFQHNGTAPELVEKLTPLNGDGLAFKVITNRGTEVWPGGNVETFCTDHFVVRYLSESTTNHKAIAALLGRIADAGIDFIKTENLCTFDGKDAFSLGRGK